MKLTVSDATVPVGNFVGQFTSVEPHNHKEYGDGLLWKFRISQGPQTGKTALRFTGPTPSPNTIAGHLAAGLLGRPLKPDEEIDFANFVGKSFLIIVEPAKKEGMTRVAAITPVAPA